MLIKGLVNYTVRSNGVGLGTGRCKSCNKFFSIKDIIYTEKRNCPNCGRDLFT